MMRFTRQRTRYDCSAVAILNSCTFFGQKLSYSKNKKDLASLLNLTEKGCRTSYFVNLMKRIHKLKFFNIRTTSILTNNRGIGIVITDKQIPMILAQGHVFIIIKENPKTFTCINYYSNRTVSNIRKKTLYKALRYGNIVINLKRGDL